MKARISAGGALVIGSSEQPGRAEAAELSQAQASYSDLATRREQVAAQLQEAQAAVTACSLRLAHGDDSDASEEFQRATARVSQLRSTALSFDETVLPAASARLHAAREAEANSVRLFDYQAANKAAKLAAARLEREYPEIMQRLTALIREVATASAFVELANRCLPAGEPAIAGPEERIRDRKALPRVQASSEVVEEWVFAATGQRLSTEMTRDVRVVGDGVGHLPNKGLLAGEPSRVIKRKFRKVQYQEAVSWASGPRLDSLVLPGLKHGSRAYWEPGMQPLAGRQPDAGELTRPLKVELIDLEIGDPAQ